MAGVRRQTVPPAIAVLCSGRGTNLQAIIEAIRTRRLRARIVVVISDQPNAFALTRARRAGLPTRIVYPKQFPTRDAFDRQLVGILKAANVQLVCLAGFMRVLSASFVRQFPNRILNIHPALLPAFPGAHAIRDALAWGAKVTGVTVHIVDEQVDHGPIMLQEPLPIRPRETEAMLLSRVHRVEHRLYPRAIHLVLTGRLRVRGRRTALVK